MTTTDPSPSSVTVDFTLQIGKGRLQASAQVPVHPVTPTELLPVLQDLSNNIVAATVSTVQAEGYAVSCRAGCGACCRQLVPVTLFEMEGLANWVRSLPPEQKAVLEARFHAAVAALTKAGILERLDFAAAPKRGSPAEYQLVQDYLHVGVACPFLQDESCGIHPIRPLSCREYLVTSPPQFCASPTPEKVRPVPMPLRLSHALVQMSEQLSTETRGWIPLVLLFGWINSGIQLGDAFKMPGPELLRHIVEQLVTPEADGPAR